MRYAKKVVLQIPTQSENPSKLYPPKLILEYATTTSGSWTGEEGIILLSKVEYSHKTENFWASIQIMIGFILAFAVVIFGVPFSIISLNNIAQWDVNSPDIMAATANENNFTPICSKSLFQNIKLLFLKLNGKSFLLTF